MGVKGGQNTFFLARTQKGVNYGGRDKRIFDKKRQKRL